MKNECAEDMCVSDSESAPKVCEQKRQLFGERRARAAAILASIDCISSSSSSSCPSAMVSSAAAAGVGVGTDLDMGSDVVRMPTWTWMRRQALSSATPRAQTRRCPRPAPRAAMPPSSRFRDVSSTGWCDLYAFSVVYVLLSDGQHRTAHDGWTLDALADLAHGSMSRRHNRGLCTAVKHLLVEDGDADWG